MRPQVYAQAVDRIDNALIIRALALRKLKKIGVLWAENDRVYVSQCEFDPYGSRVRVSMEQLREIVETAELAQRKPPRSERISKKTLHSRNVLAYS